VEHVWGRVQIVQQLRINIMV